jgi:hypothetical protein
MTILTDKIYYADQEILKLITTDFDVLDEKNWYELYQNKNDKSYWRLDKSDKYQQRMFVRLESKENWVDLDDKELRIGLLLKKRDVSEQRCIWNSCNKPALLDLAYCERHAYEEFGIRR